ALVAALRTPDRWQSVSALAPVCNPSRSSWGRKAFSHFFGNDRSEWDRWDACALMRGGRRHPGRILVDQGEADPFLTSQRHADALEVAAKQVGQGLSLRRHPGYDHGASFVQTFIADHLEHHASELIG
ncbi:MAG: alpha/beta hydrolase-fold protein, partial [Gammaproteobacteria bacterium]